jgi:hypothetical protein
MNTKVFPRTVSTPHGPNFGHGPEYELRSIGIGKDATNITHATILITCAKAVMRFLETVII